MSAEEAAKAVNPMATAIKYNNTLKALEGAQSGTGAAVAGSLFSAVNEGRIEANQVYRDAFTNTGDWRTSKGAAQEILMNEERVMREIAANPNLTEDEKAVLQQQTRDKPSPAIMAHRKQRRKHALQSQDFNRQQHQILEHRFLPQRHDIQHCHDQVQRKNSENAFQVKVLERRSLHKRLILVRQEQHIARKHKERRHEHSAHRDKSRKRAKIIPMVNIAMEQ